MVSSYQKTHENEWLSDVQMSIKTRGSQTPPSQLFIDAGFITLYSQIVFDYYNLEKFYSQVSDSFNDGSRIDFKATVVNGLKILDRIETSDKAKGSRDISENQDSLSVYSTASITFYGKHPKLPLNVI